MDLKPFESDSLEWFFVADPAAAAARNVETEVAADLRHEKRTKRRVYLHALEIANAAKHLQALPGPEESLHCVNKGNFHSWDLVPAILRLAAPAKIRRLDITTLGFSKQNIQELVELMDAGEIGEVTFICSCYFRSSSASEWDFLAEQLTARGAPFAAVRCHAKIMLMEMTDGNSYVIESSANLRSCHNVEQFSLSNDAGLLNFHRTWTQTLIEQACHAAAQKKAQQENASTPTQASAPSAKRPNRKPRPAPPIAPTI